MNSMEGGVSAAERAIRYVECPVDYSKRLLDERRWKEDVEGTKYEYKTIEDYYYDICRDSLVTMDCNS